MSLKVALKILDPRLPGWGFPHYGSGLAAGLDLHACIEETLVLRPQAPAVLIASGIAFRIGDPEGACLISAWNRNPARAGDDAEGIVIAPGDRIAQLVFTRIARAEFTIVSDFGVADGRQAGGFGSTGIASACPNRAAGRHS